MSELNRSDIDEQFFIQKVEQQVQMIEKCFLQIRNNCLMEFDKVKANLPDEIKKNLPFLEGYTSFPVSTYSKKKMSSRHLMETIDDDQDDDDNDNDNDNDDGINNENEHKYDKLSINNHDQISTNGSHDDSIASVGMPKSTKSKSKSVGMGSTIVEEEQNNTTTNNNNNINDITNGNTNGNIEMISDVEFDSKQSDGDEEDEDSDDDDDDDEDDEDDDDFEFELNKNTRQRGMHQIPANRSKTGDNDMTERSHTRTLTQTRTHTKSDLSSEHKNNNTNNNNNNNRISIADEDFIDAFAPLDKDGYPLVKPPKCVFRDYQLFSHLPSGSHKQCLMILRTLGRLKLFGWQNSEGLRKIIKKFDKRFGCSLTQTLWPKIKLSEFVQEIKTDSYIAQVAAVLCTSRIPFDNFDAKELREQGMNLRQMATAIQQLETVVEMQYPEVIPMNVEPRSYMANERTWLKWMRMGAFTILVGMILIGMGHEPVTGIILVLLSIAVMCRSYLEYNMRNRCLTARKDHNWIDPIGPKLLMLSFLLPCFTYFAYLIYFKDNQVIFHK